MVGKNCVAIASDLRLGNQALTVATNFDKVLCGSLVGCYYRLLTSFCVLSTGRYSPSQIVYSLECRVWQLMCWHCTHMIYHMFCLLILLINLLDASAFVSASTCIPSKKNVKLSPRRLLIWSARHFMNGGDHDVTFGLCRSITHLSPLLSRISKVWPLLHRACHCRNQQPCSRFQAVHCCSWPNRLS